MAEDYNSKISALEEEKRRLIAQHDKLMSAQNFQSVKAQAGRIGNKIAQININLIQYRDLQKSGYGFGEAQQKVAKGNLQTARALAQSKTAKELGIGVQELKRRAIALKKPAQKGTAVKIIQQAQQGKTSANKLNLLFNTQSNPLTEKLNQLQKQYILNTSQSKIPKASIGSKAKGFLLTQSGYNMYENNAKQEETKITNSLTNYANIRQGYYQRQVNDGRISVDKATELLNKDIDAKYNSLVKDSEFFREKNARTQTTNALSYQYETDRLDALKQGQKYRADALLFLREVADTPSALIKAGVGVKNFLQKFSKDPKTREESIAKIKKVLPTSFKDYVNKMDVLQKKVYLKTKDIAKFVITSPTTAVAEVGGSMVGFGILSKGSKPVLKATKVFSKKASEEIVERLGIKALVKQGLKLPALIEVEISPTILKTARGVTGTASKVRSTTSIIKKLEKGAKTTKNINAIAKDIKKLIPKTIPKVRLLKVEKAMKPVIENFLKNKNVLLDLRKKFPTKTNFTLKEIKASKYYPKLKTILKRRVFSKYDIKTLRKKGVRVRPGKNRIRGVKVSRREFKTFQEAEKQFKSFKNIGKFVKKITNKGGVGKIESLPKRPLTKADIEYFKVAKKIPRQFFANADKVSVNTFVQKFSARVPVIKRFGNLKKGYWKLVIEDKPFYQNSVSFSLYKKGGKPLGTITFNTLSSKPITRFRSLESALKWGTNKNIVLSKSVGKNFVRSYMIRSRGMKITAKEFLSKIKITSKGNLQDIFIKTKKIPKYTSRRNVKKQFKRSIPVSVTRGKIAKTKVPTIVKWNKKKGYLEITQRGRVIKAIKTKSIINPVIIDTSKIETIARKMNKIKMKNLSRAKIMRIKKAKKMLLSTKKSKTFTLNGKKKVAIPKAQLQQLKSLEKETNLALKESLAGRSIAPRVKITKRVQGIKQLKKLQRTEKALKKVRRDLIKRKALDSATKTALAKATRLVSRMKSKTKLKQGLHSIIKSKEIKREIQGLVELQKLKSKCVLKVINVLKKEIPMIPIPIIRTPRTIPRPPKPKLRKAIVIPRSKESAKKFKRLSKPTKIFSIIVRKRGKAVVLKDRLIERDALNVMAYELDNQLLRTARLKQMGTSKLARKIPKKYQGAFTKRKKKLRQYKIKKKKKIAIRGFIEKKRFALDTPGEKTQLKRLTKKRVRKKPIKKRAVKKKTARRKVKKKVAKKKILRKKRSVKRRK